MDRPINSILQKTFATERLSLVALTVEDAPFIFELTNSQGWLSFIGDRNIQSISDAENYIKKINGNPDVKYWKVNLKEDQTSIGLVTLIKRDYLDDFDIGFALLPQYTKKGYAFEATKIVLTAVIPNTSTKQIVAITQVDNISSIQLLKKLGLQYDRLIQDGGTDLQVYRIDQDKFSIDQLTHSFFSIFTNKNGKTPDWNLIHQVCIPEAIIIKKDKTEQYIYNLETFIAPRKKILSDGTLVKFEEREIEETTTIMGHIAQRSTRFQKTGQYNESPFDQLGNKLFQYIKTEAGWRICGVVWEDEKR